VARHLIFSAGLLLLAGACASYAPSPAPVSASQNAKLELDQAAAACPKPANTATPWIGNWSARTGEAIVKMSIDGANVRGSLTTSVTTFAFTGGVGDTGYINITLSGNDLWDRAEMGGKFPVIQLSSGSDGRSFETIDGFQFRLCT
jgi:hypothetical protein